MSVTRRSYVFSHEIDHVIAQKHGGATDSENLALTCWRCNRHKGTDLGSFDPETGAFNFLFNPRTQKWTEYFSFLELHLVGLTPSERTTIGLLQMNNDQRLTERRRLRSVKKRE